MKRLFTTAAVALFLALAASAFAENGYRVNYYVPDIFEPGTTKPFVYHTIYIGETEASVRAAIYEQSPTAVVLSVEYMGVAETTTDTSYDPHDPNSNAQDDPADLVPAAEPCETP